MTTTYLGSLTVGGVMPGAAAVGVAGAAGIGAVLPDLTSRLASLLAWSPTPITLAAQIGQLEAMIGALQAQLTLGVAPPSLATQLANLAAIVAGLEAQIAGVNVQLDIITDFQALLGAAGIHALAFAGLAGALGSELDARLASVPGLGPGDTANALVLLTTVPATWTALAQLLKVTP